MLMMTGGCAMTRAKNSCIFSQENCVKLLNCTICYLQKVEFVPDFSLVHEVVVKISNNESASVVFVCRTFLLQQLPVGNLYCHCELSTVRSIGSGLEGKQLKLVFFYTCTHANT